MFLISCFILCRFLNDFIILTHKNMINCQCPCGLTFYHLFLLRICIFFIDCLLFWRRPKRSVLDESMILAGVAGLEPTHAETKTRCLTNLAIPQRKYRTIIAQNFFLLKSIFKFNTSSKLIQNLGKNVYHKQIQGI